MEPLFWSINPQKDEREGGKKRGEEGLDGDESGLVRHTECRRRIKIARFGTTPHAGCVKVLVDSTPLQGNMKSIDLLFTSDSFEHKTCDVSVANLQSQYTFLYITLTCKGKGKREKEIPVILDRGPRSPLSFVLEGSGWLLCLLLCGSDAVEREG